MLRRLADSEWTALAVCALATVVAGRPWILDPALGFTQRDTGFAAVGYDWLQTALLTGADPWATPLGWPAVDPTTHVDWMAGEALIGLPFRLAGWEPFTSHEAIVAIGLFVSAWACHRAARALTGAGPHTWVAAVVGGIGAVHLAHAQHVNLVHDGVAVGAAVLAGAGLVTRRAAWCVAGGGLAGLAGHFGAYMGVHAVLVVGAVAAVALASRLGDARSWVGLGLGALAGGATLLPVVARYARAADVRGVVMDAREIAVESWDPATTFSPNAGALLHDPLYAPTSTLAAQVALHPPNPGYVAVMLAGLGGVALARSRTPLRWAPVVVLGLALALALGPEIAWNGAPTGVPGPYHLVDLVSGGARLRSPARWLAIAQAAVGILAAAGLARIAPPSASGALLVGTLAVGLALGELPVATSSPLTSARIEPAARALAAVEGEGALYERLRDGCTAGEASVFRLATWHGRPLVAGNYARPWAPLQQMNRVLGSWPSPEAATLLRAVATRVVYEHPPLPPLPPLAGRCDEVDGHRICALDPLPVPAALTPTPPTPDAPVVALRWARPPKEKRVEVWCGDTVQTVLPPVWALVARLRGGPPDVVLDPPCATPPTVLGVAAGAPSSTGVVTAAPTPLYAVDTAVWPPPPPPRPR
ncbi:MAG: hypothetical protein V4850_27830 [Myxococcota bacterium]